MIRWTWLVRNFEYPFEWTRRQKSVVFEVERAQKTFSRDFVGARSILDLDNYVERKKRERKKRDSDRGEVENGKRIRRLLRRILASLPSGLRRGGIQVRKLRGNLLERGWICLSFHMKPSRVQRERKPQMIFLFWKDWRVVNPLRSVIVIRIIYSEVHYGIELKKFGRNENVCFLFDKKYQVYFAMRYLMIQIGNEKYSSINIY